MCLGKATLNDSHQELEDRISVFVGLNNVRANSLLEKHCAKPYASALIDYTAESHFHTPLRLPALLAPWLLVTRVNHRSSTTAYSSNDWPYSISSEGTQSEETLNDCTNVFPAPPSKQHHASTINPSTCRSYIILYCNKVAMTKLAVQS